MVMSFLRRVTGLVSHGKVVQTDSWLEAANSNKDPLLTWLEANNGDNGVISQVVLLKTGVGGSLGYR